MKTGKHFKLGVLGVLLWAMAPQAKAQSIDSALLLNDLKTLSSAEFEGRKPGTKGHEKAMKFMVDRFKSLGLNGFSPDFLHTFQINDSLTGKNVVAYIPGKKPGYIVISGHYDHVGIRNGQTYYGADDNASGAVSLLAIAAYFMKNPPQYTLVFASFDAEEMGLRGARAFVENPPIPLDEIVINLNLDMVSRNDQNRLIAAGTHHTPTLIPYIKNSTKSVTVHTGYDVPGTGRNDWTNQSDQGAFHRVGIPWIYFGVEDHPDYHTPRDTFENIQPSFFYQAVQSILAITKEIDATFVRPAKKEAGQ
jgi:Zn-dependent M28 family amino/carboxypeptidase